MDEIAYLEAVEVDSGGDVRGVPSSSILAGWLVSVNETGNFFTQEIVNYQ